MNQLRDYCYTGGLAQVDSRYTGCHDRIDKLEENIPSPTFRVDLKTYFGNSKSKKTTKNIPPKYQNLDGGKHSQNEVKIDPT